MLPDNCLAAAKDGPPTHANASCRNIVDPTRPGIDINNAHKPLRQSDDTYRLPVASTTTAVIAESTWENDVASTQTNRLRTR